MMAVEETAHPAVDRLASALIVSDLIERPDGRWAEWRGLNRNQAARKLTQSPSGCAKAFQHSTADDLATPKGHT